jgi:protein gp37/ParB-like chromosome segregation protein Spo0J
MAQIVDKRAVGLLRPHPENDRIYGDQADEGLVASVRAKGILNPLLITPVGQIISGHRRWDAAKKCGMPEVPVVVFASTDETDILEALLESNRQREKDGEQLGREYEAALKIEAKRAELRMLAGKRTEADPVVNSPQGRKKTAPKAGDLAAERIGVTRQKAERASTVNRVVGALKQQGREQEAERLRKALRTQSVNKAWTQAKANGHVEAKAVVRREVIPEDRLITLDVWRGLDAEQRQQVLARPAKKGVQFNPQKSTDIEWAQWSWNPVTGCKHDCSYCYARDIAAGTATKPGIYSWGFVPAFLPEKLGAPAQTTVPPRAEHDRGYANVFTCSMADLFGRWVPTEWIEAVLDQARGNPQWNFLFLTKFPIRLQEFEFPDNAWVGTTVDAQARVANAERAFEKVNAKVKWLSCEPLLEPLQFTRLDLFQWIVMGGASGSSQTPLWRPPRPWIDDLRGQARRAGCRIYEKTNLLERLREYPGQPDPERMSVPDAYKMPYLQRDVLEPDAYAQEMAR